MEQTTATLERRAWQYGRVIFVVTFLFVPLGVSDLLTTGATLGLLWGLLLLITTPIYMYAQGRLPVRPITLAFFVVQLASVGAVVHNAGGFLANLAALYCTLLFGVGLVLATPRWNAAATALAITSYVALGILELTGVVPMNKPGQVLMTTSFSYQMLSLISLVLVLIGTGLLVTIVMREVTLREQQLQTVTASLKQRAEHTEQLALDIESANQELQTKEDLLRETVDALTITALPVSEGVIVLPLIGVFDQVRAHAVQKRVIDDLHTKATQAVIVDLTGVSLVNEDFVWMLGRILNGARLLGVDVVIAGLQPEIARGLVDVGFDRSRIRSVSTLAQAIKVAQPTGVAS